MSRLGHRGRRRYRNRGRISVGLIDTDTDTDTDPDADGLISKGGLETGLNGAKISLSTLFVASFVESQPVRP
jgi:hypothetical protein